jgi:hypothetical protein
VVLKRTGDQMNNLKVKCARPVMITIEEASKIAKVSTRTVYRWIDENNYNGIIYGRINRKYGYRQYEVFGYFKYNNATWVEAASFIKALKALDKI